MSELKWNWAYYPHLDPPEKQAESALKAGYIKVVNKDEADKVIADLEESHKKEVEQLLMEIVELKKKLVEQATLRAWAEIQLRHNKHKRCLAMAWWCSAELGMLVSTWESKIKHYKKWQKRWLELAEKFKEAK